MCRSRGYVDPEGMQIRGNRESICGRSGVNLVCNAGFMTGNGILRTCNPNIPLSMMIAYTEDCMIHFQVERILNKLITMKALVLHGLNDLRLDDIPEPTAGPGSIIISVIASPVWDYLVYARFMMIFPALTCRQAGNHGWNANISTHFPTYLRDLCSRTY